MFPLSVARKFFPVMGMYSWRNLIGHRCNNCIISVNKTSNTDIANTPFLPAEKGENRSSI